jgi:hypothetical protein
MAMRFGTSGDGTEGCTTADEDAFSAWLAENGATYPKIEWPTRETVGGVRGTTARADIASNEKDMLRIPLKLMMAPPTTEASAEFGEVMRAYHIVPRGSMLALTVFLLLEKVLKRESSFWWPYVRMLPHPGTTLDWNAAELVELQDETVHSESQRMRAQHAQKFVVVFEKLRERFGSIFGATVAESERLGFTSEEWEWCAMNVQARCFGRRLPWLALVPFADSLNHANVATKYDFDTESNGCFRLFPVGTNSYAAGSEVFNSYGRRDNRHLLVHYGFAMEGNEHDTLTIRVAVHECARVPRASVEEGGAGWTSTMISKRAERYRLLSRRGVCHHGRLTMRLRTGLFAADMLDLCRVAVMSDDDVVAALRGPGAEEGGAGAGAGGAAAAQGVAGDLASERDAIAVAIIVFERELAQFATTLAEDEALLGVRTTRPCALRAACFV